MSVDETLPCESEDRVDAAYRRHYGLLWAIAAERFRVPPTDVDNVVQDVFVTFLRRYAAIQNERAWLVSAICDASRTYWRRKGRTPPADELPDGDAAPEDTRSTPADVAALARVDAAALMRGLRPRCRHLLCLHYCDELTAPEIATIYGTSERYTKLMLHRCMRAARKLLDVERRQ